MVAYLTSLLSGLLFAVGLCVAHVTQPAKVVDFLDFTGHWDPSLACVIAGAISVHFYFARRSLSMRAPIAAASFSLPRRTDIDWKLAVGAAIFGVGWGMTGYCPGPALTSVPAAAPTTLAFLGAMIVGTLVARLALRPARSTGDG